MIAAIYADGGVVGRNPSKIGGTWAWCHVDQLDQRITMRRGTITPLEAEMPIVTNNLTELYALVLGLEYLPADWSGPVYSDSQCSLGRLFEGWKMTNIPAWLIERSRKAVVRLGTLQPILLDGHPSRAELATGKGKSGRPVSEHNVWCDTSCREAARVFLNGVAA